MLRQVRSFTLCTRPPGEQRVLGGALEVSAADRGVKIQVRRNRQIAASDLSELGRIFLEAGIGIAADLDRSRDADGGLGVCLRFLTGLDREAARDAFEEFQGGQTFSSAQLRYVDLLVHYVARNV